MPVPGADQRGQGFCFGSNCSMRSWPQDPLLAEEQHLSEHLPLHLHSSSHESPFTDGRTEAQGLSGWVTAHLFPPTSLHPWPG